MNLNHPKISWFCHKDNWWKLWGKKKRPQVNLFLAHFIHVRTVCSPVYVNNCLLSKNIVRYLPGTTTAIPAKIVQFIRTSICHVVTFKPFLMLMLYNKMYQNYHFLFNRNSFVNYLEFIQGLSFSLLIRNCPVYHCSKKNGVLQLLVWICKTLVRV